MIFSKDVDRHTSTGCRLIMSIIVGSLLCCGAEAQDIDSHGVEFFEKRIRPVLAEHCYQCHGPAAKRVEANLRIDSLAGLFKGGDRGPAISADEKTQSLLLSAIQYDELEMPPDGKLPDRVIADFKTWIDAGMPAPKSFHDNPADNAAASQPEIDWEQARQHWAFRPIQVLAPPVVHDGEWNANPIDAFVFDQLTRHGQQPAPPADRHALVRRLYLNLIGLPPTVDEVNRFINDTSGDAYARLIEHLLASPHYGERWGRHWLDVVRYADSNGADENHPYPHAWRYRNYVIDAFNRDTPFDQFVTEQLAGDLLSPVDDYDSTNRRLTATTFLALGIKIDAEKDQEKKRADIIDEQLDTMGRALLGLTIGCARCHDHKFDPIPTSDYYALSGILRSTNLQNRKLSSAEEDKIRESLSVTESQVSDVLQRERTRVLAAASENVQAYMSAAGEVNAWRRANRDKQLAQRLSPTIKGPSLQPIGEISCAEDFDLPGVWLDAESFDRGEAAIDADHYGKGIGIVSDRGGGKTWVEYDFELPAEGIYQVEFRYAAANPRPGKLSINQRVVHQQSMSQTTGSWYPDTQSWFVEGRFRFVQGKNTLRFEVEPNMSHLDQLIVARVGEQAVGPAATSAKHGAAASPAEIARRDSLDIQVLQCWADLLLNAETELDSTEPATLVEQLAAPRGPLSEEGKYEKYVSAQAMEQLARLRGEIAELNNQLKDFAERQVMAVAEGTIDDTHILIRGNHLAAGPIVPRRFLTIIAGDDQEAYPPNQSGRLALARSITAEENPLTARVIVNRIWRWHFGRGIVDSTDNFGLAGGTPTHPELLDFLARYLVEHDWSIKDLQRLIVSSRTFRSSSQLAQEQANLDPENRNLWRWQPRRMEAEVLRDSLLKISGRLDSRIGDAPFQGVTTANPSPHDLENNRQYYQDSRRRSIYLPVVRTNVYKFLTLFDFPNPAASAGDRDATTVPTQALFLLNSSWIRDLATEFYRDEISPYKTTTRRIERVYLAVLGRHPSRQELALASRFVGEDEDSWPAFCHLMFMSNEFLYIK